MKNKATVVPLLSVSEDGHLTSKCLTTPTHGRTDGVITVSNDAERELPVISVNQVIDTIAFSLADATDNDNLTLNHMILGQGEDIDNEMLSPKRIMSPAIIMQLKELRKRFLERTESFRRRTLEISTSDDSEEEEEEIETLSECGTSHKESYVEPHELNPELVEEVESHIAAAQIKNWCMPKPGCCMKSCKGTIAPQSHLYLVWLFLVTLAYIYNVISILLRATFTIYYNEHTYHVWMCIDYLCDLVYILDLTVIKPRLQFIKDGLLEVQPSETRRNYCRSFEFKLDLASLLPLDVFYCVVGIYGSAQPLLRLPRYLKLKSAWEFFDRFDQAAKSGHVIRVARTMTYMLFLIHVETCGYYAISVYEGIGINEWVYNGHGFAYIRCFYLATKTATSIGNNPKPTNQLEYLFMTVYWLSGVFVFALLLGQIRDIFESANSVKTSYQKAQDSTLQYLQNLNVPKRLQNKVRDWFNYNWDQQKTLNENLLVDILPTKMKTDLFITVHYATLSKVSLFQDCEKTLLSDLILKLKPVIFQPGDYICRKGEVGTEMYIIMHGEVEVVNDEGNILVTLAIGSVFGEISLMGLTGGNRRTANVRSRGYSNLFILSKYDFERAMEDYPQAHSLLKKRAQKLLKRPAQQKKKKESAAAIHEAEPISDNNTLKTVKPLRFYQSALKAASRQSSRITAWLKGNNQVAIAKSDSTVSLERAMVKSKESWKSVESLKSVSKSCHESNNLKQCTGMPSTSIGNIDHSNECFELEEGLRSIIDDEQDCDVKRITQNGSVEASMSHFTKVV